MKHSEKNEIASHELPTTPLDPVLAAGRESKIKVAMIGLCGCWGCTLSFLDMDERLLVLLDKVTLHRSSLSDIKRITERCAIGFIEGGVANEENIETLEHYRENCDVLISVGACAVWGGVPAMRNVFELKDCLSEVYIDSATSVPGAKPVVPFHPDIPRITDKVYPCHEVVKMDYFIPGCPPDADAIFKVLDDLVNGRPFDLPSSINQYD
ncbi:NADP oxidoreductase [Rhodococcus opacus]|nr:NAD-reducing hydrogenase delta subunit [Rhodococcus opacus]AAB57891.1 NAD-reducing hydrogenase delta subunit [Rhodococcus opacus]MDX5962569.1 NADP oxidoreductase [Rhodococcus opacus]CAG7641224.1 NAD-reducing hydrogenase HoxS subunit delta [Rhodococcus opacus]